MGRENNMKEARRLGITFNITVINNKGMAISRTFYCDVGTGCNDSNDSIDYMFSVLAEWSYSYEGITAIYATLRGVMEVLREDDGTVEFRTRELSEDDSKPRVYPSIKLFRHDVDAMYKSGKWSPCGQ